MFPDLTGNLLRMKLILCGSGIRKTLLHFRFKMFLLFLQKRLAEKRCRNDHLEPLVELWGYVKFL